MRAFGYSYFVLAALCLFANPSNAQDVTCNLRTDTTTFWPPRAMSKPAYLETLLDSTFGTKITRIVGNPGDPIPNLQGQLWAAEQERHEYSKLSVWNCDQSMMYLNRHYPNLWLDGNTYQALFTRSKPGEHLVWSHTEPNIMYHTGSSGSCRLGKWNVVSDVDSELVDLRAYSSCSFGESEGNFTWDGTKVAVYGNRLSDNKKVIFVVDVTKRTKGPDIDLLNLLVFSFDNCTISPYGNYIVIVTGSGSLKVLHANDGTLVWSELYEIPSHFDVQVDQNGDEVIVGVSKEAPYSGRVIKRRLSDGVITPLTKSGYASHTSGRNLKRPGWVFVTYQDLQPYPQYLPYLNEIDAVKLDGSRVERICNIRVNKELYPTDDTKYLAEAHGCASPDGLRVIFASDWNKGAFPVQAYVVDFRDKVIPTAVRTAEKRSALNKASIVNFPNPFNSSTRIEFTVPEDGYAAVKVFDLLGREVANLYDGFVRSGKQVLLQFDGGSLPTGIYFCQLQFGGHRITNAMMFLK